MGSQVYTIMLSLWAVARPSFEVTILLPQLPAKNDDLHIFVCLLLDLSLFVLPRRDLTEAMHVLNDKVSYDTRNTPHDIEMRSLYAVAALPKLTSATLH